MKTTNIFFVPGIELTPDSLQAASAINESIKEARKILAPVEPLSELIKTAQQWQSPEELTSLVQLAATIVSDVKHTYNHS